MNKRKKLIMRNNIAQKRQILWTISLEEKTDPSEQLFADLDDEWLKRYSHELRMGELRMGRSRQ